MSNPASHVIQKCGGLDAVAAITGRHKSNVARWTYGKERGGTGGLIPSDAQLTLLRGARERGIDLRPEDFFGAEFRCPQTEEDAA